MTRDLAIAEIVDLRGGLADLNGTYLSLGPEHSAGHMQEMVQGMLQYARLGRVETPLQPTNLEDVLRRVLHVLQREIKRNPATITHDPLPTVQGYPRLIEQVMQNLLGNALKFRSPERALTIHVGARREPDCWLVWVQDNGIGMDPAKQSRIFEIFHRLHPEGAYPGTGLGLAICEKIVENHGGKIRVELQPNQGSVFYFTFPDRQNQPMASVDE